MVKRKHLILLIIFCTPWAHAQAPRVIDVATRMGVTQRFLLIQPQSNATPKAAVILFAGGDGGVRLSPEGALGALRGNFLMRSRDAFAAHGLLVAVIDAPSDRQAPPFLGGFRQTAQHVTDVKAVIAWLRQETELPVWLIGTSRGTQSAAYIATQAAPADGGPNGVVLTASILRDPKGRPLPDMALERIGVPVLVVHHRQDGCHACLFADLPRLTGKLGHLKRGATMVFDGGVSVGDPCQARAHHGFNGIEDEVIGKIAAWVLAQ
ncbi:MAG: alpha/beta hydrolase [Betaproteobacteria bacterium]|nr:alpha/beta hydrolase [Betaproteobacteria bacterium]